MKNISIGIILVSVMVLILAGCSGELITPGENIIPVGDDELDNGTDSGKGTLKLYLTDAPGDYLEVNILISHIDCHLAVAEQEEEQEQEGLDTENNITREEDDVLEVGEWKNLADWSEDGGLLINLIDLQDQSILLSTNELDAGTYTQLRVFLMENANIVIEGEEGEEDLETDLIIPSSAQTGIKLIHPFEIRENEITELTLDFDAEKSVKKTGNGKYLMNPTIKVITEYSTE